MLHSSIHEAPGTLERLVSASVGRNPDKIDISGIDLKPRKITLPAIHEEINIKQGLDPSTLHNPLQVNKSVELSLDFQKTAINRRLSEGSAFTQWQASNSTKTIEFAICCLVVISRME